MATKEEEELRAFIAEESAKPLPKSVQAEVDLVDEMSLEELQETCVLPMCRDASVRSNEPALRQTIKDFLKSGLTLEMLKLGYNPAKTSWGPGDPGWSDDD